MASSWPPKKGVAFTLFFTLYKSDGTVIANPGTITKKVSIDGAAVADIAASVTEEDTTYGQCSVQLSTSEMNGDAIWVYIKDDTTGCVPFTATLYTAAQTLDEVYSRIGAPAGASIAADLVTIDNFVDDLESRLTAARAGYLDALNSGVPVASIANGAVTAAAVATGAIDADAIAADAVTEIQSGLSTLDAAGVRTAVGLASANLDTQIGDLPTNTELGTALAAADDAVLAAVAGLNDFDPTSDVVAHVTLVDTTTTNTDMVAAAPSAASVADAVWDEAAAGHTDAGKAGQQLWTDVDAILADTGELQTNQGDWATAAGFSTHSAADAADAVWDETLAGHAGVGSAGAALSAAGGSGDPWSTALPGTYEAGTAGAILGTTIPAAIDAVDNYVDSEVTALTNELAKVPKSDGTASWNSTALAAIQGECTDALDAYDPPTKAELDAADDAVLAAVAALNNFDPTSDVVAHVTLVDTTTTNTDMVDVSGITVDNAAIADAVWDEVLSGHADVGSSGAALTAAGVAGDPWTAELPGSYAAGTAGAVLPALDAAVSALGAGDVTVVSPVAAGGTITIEQSDSYPSALGRAITVAIADATHALALDGADCDVYLRGTQFTWTAASVTSTTTGWTVTWTPTVAQTTPLTLTKQAYKIVAFYDNTAPTADDAVTIARGTAVLKKDIPAVS